MAMRPEEVQLMDRPIDVFSCWFVIFINIDQQLGTSIGYTAARGQGWSDVTRRVDRSTPPARGRAACLVQLQAACSLHQLAGWSARLPPTMLSARVQLTSLGPAVEFRGHGCSDVTRRVDRSTPTAASCSPCGFLT